MSNFNPSIKGKPYRPGLKKKGGGKGLNNLNKVNTQALKYNIRGPIYHCLFIILYEKQYYYLIL